ncbi:MAG: lysylphosphatidylglycerol synthase transmembrane domain-containing protein [Bacteroidetes bacterium]|nr:lysylphosphatidylglycerol synthase transmembrane domain-containing protein [Bacteroidota bacterium]MDA0938296.1 lysylphosphatidylglycerol synthase transmembrane domain-containing protein [Bacteroidota bacterium]MDA1344589.1 lysylphosphatidylglycerol synthase transmembrane domain-containing protein [Bacteroidota bacterium]
MAFLKTLFLKILPLTIGVFFIWLSIRTTTPEERNAIIESIQNANYFFVGLSIFFAVLSHLSRAYRWKYLLQPLGYKPRFINSVLTVMIAYLANLGVPRSGEILRATALSNYEKLPFEKVFGTVVAERIVDLLFLIFFILIALWVQFDLIWDLLRPKDFNPYSIGLLAIFGVLILLVLRQYFKTSQKRWVIKIKTLFIGFLQGIKSVLSMPHKGLFMLHTVFIWTMYLAMFYTVKWAMPETDALTLTMVIPAFVAGGIVISATNGGIGVYPFTVALVLEGFGISNQAGLAFGWIMWSSQMLMILVFGALSFFALPLVNRAS